MILTYFSDSKSKDLCPILAGHYLCPASNTYGPHIRDYCIIHFVLSGRGTLINERGTHSVSAGQMFIIREGEVTTYIADKDSPWEYTWIGFSGNRTADFNDVPDVIDTPAELDIKVYEHVKQGVKSSDIYSSILYELLHHLSVVENDESNEEWIRSVHRYIKYNYMENITISGLAAQFGFERSYLYRIFKQRYGIGPKDYLTKIRMEKAKWLLSKGHSVSECAYMVGYADAFAFSKAYKKHFGVAPTYDEIFSTHHT